MTLQQQFHEDMMRLYNVAAQHAYRPTIFMQVVEKLGNGSIFGSVA